MFAELSKLFADPTTKDVVDKAVAASNRLQIIHTTILDDFEQYQDRFEKHMKIARADADVMNKFAAQMANAIIDYNKRQEQILQQQQQQLRQQQQQAAYRMATAVGGRGAAAYGVLNGYRPAAVPSAASRAVAAVAQTIPVTTISTTVPPPVPPRPDRLIGTESTLRLRSTSRMDNDPTVVVNMPVLADGISRTTINDDDRTNTTIDENRNRPATTTTTKPIEADKSTTKSGSFDFDEHPSENGDWNVVAPRRNTNTGPDQPVTSIRRAKSPPIPIPIPTPKSSRLNNARNRIAAAAANAAAAGRRSISKPSSSSAAAVYAAVASQPSASIKPKSVSESPVEKTAIEPMLPIVLPSTSAERNGLIVQTKTAPDSKTSDPSSPKTAKITRKLRLVIVGRSSMQATDDAGTACVESVVSELERSLSIDWIDGQSVDPDPASVDGIIVFVQAAVGGRDPDTASVNEHLRPWKIDRRSAVVIVTAESRYGSVADRGEFTGDLLAATTATILYKSNGDLWSDAGAGRIAAVADVWKGLLAS